MNCRQTRRTFETCRFSYVVKYDAHWRNMWYVVGWARYVAGWARKSVNRLLIGTKLSACNWFTLTWIVSHFRQSTSYSWSQLRSRRQWHRKCQPTLALPLRYMHCNLPSWRAYAMATHRTNTYPSRSDIYYLIDARWHCRKPGCRGEIHLEIPAIEFQTDVVRSICGLQRKTSTRSRCKVRSSSPCSRL